ncbi:amino acid transporter [Nadsonia fulvescens var. elongata DSM 6958]|uniref:Amino acid transporter n=1 Tax=Nadsonia fulvescens var. elongata DSM 6958 TaxID=857566 RepID=A0A1E3PL13_9ASCO|nr:amino acid transporter [Nadsonia fulvescens var. elongata DSM 6958]
MDVTEHRPSSENTEKINISNTNDSPIGEFNGDSGETIRNTDELALQALGYKQEFKREFSLFSSFAVSFSVLGLLPSIATTLTYGVGYGGGPAMTWGWLVSMIGIQCVALSMAELCSAMPTSGGLYYAAAVLAPPKYGPFAAWITGWSNWLCQVTAAPSVNYSLSSMIMSCVTLHNPDWSPENWQIFLLASAFMLVQALISCMPTGAIARFNSLGSIFNIAGLFVVFIIILAANNRAPSEANPLLTKWNSNSFVWKDIYNQTDWTDGICILMSFTGIIWSMSGYDAPFHLAEECSNAAIAAPRAIVMTSSVGGIVGFAFQMAIAYTVVNIDEVINNDLGQPFIIYLSQIMSLKLVYLAAALTIIASFFMGQACMVAASRVAYAYARDGCFPLSRFWAQVNKTTNTPVNAVWLNCFIGQLTLFLIFAGSTAIEAIFSVGAISAYVAFTTPIFIKLVCVAGKFRPGPWHLGVFSVPIGIISCAFVLLMIPILLFPQYRGANLTPTDMNWSSVVYLGPMLFSVVWWFVDARKWFKGPKLNNDHMLYDIMGHDVDIVEGVAVAEIFSPEVQEKMARERSIIP